MPGYNRYTMPEWARHIKPVATAVLLQELKRRDYPHQVQGSRVTFLNARGKKVWFTGSNTSRNTPLARRICINKLETKAFLRSARASTPRGDVFERRDAEKALRYAHYLGFPVVVKPVGGMGGRGVFSDIRSDEEFHAAWRAQQTDTQVLVEQHVEGDDYRVYVLDGKIRAVARRDPPTIIGDGRSTIAELVAHLNKQRQASGNPIHTQIKLRGIVADFLARQGLTPDTVCEDGKHVLLRPNANVSTGGTVTDITESAPETVVREASKAAAAVPGLRVVGLDVLYVEGASAHILEMNHNPMLSLHHFPWYGRVRDVGKELIDAMIND